MSIRHTVLLIATILVFFAFPTTTRADSSDCDNFERIQSIILSERTRGTLDEDIEIARVVITKGACDLDPSFYSGYRIALQTLYRNPSECINNIHCRAYFLLDTIDPSIRETAAQASHIALTESPHFPRYHFDAWGSNAYWWDDVRACPYGWFIVGLTKVC